MLLLLGLAGGLKKPLSEDTRQRIATANCLAQQADIYLLDQPTEGMDIERRVALARALQGRTAVIADNDAWFLQAACNKALIFDGKPGMRGKAKQAKMEEATSF
jgi:ATP-binding cassette subfamily E protein 1